MRWLIPTGEALPPALCRDWLARFPRVPLMNAYGPAECSDDVAFHAVRAVADADCVVMPIGRPTANNQLYIVDPALRPVPVGVVGEIGVAGVGVGRGYVGDADRTKAVFVDNPFAPGTRFYLTGDLGRWREDGVIEFLGRRDQQVKVRGHRIELGEIESRWERHPAVEVAAVVAVPDGRGDTRLVGYWQASAGAAATAAELAEHLGRELPGYMVPSALVELAALPLSANGKVDRKALAARAIDESAGGERAYAAPRTASEVAIAGIWGEVLGVEQVSVDEPFFALGGHSLLATQVMSRVRARLGVELPLRALFEHPTVAALARAVDLARQAGEPSAAAVQPIERQPRTGPLPLSFAQQRLWFLEQLAGPSGLYVIPFALRLRGTVDAEAMRRSFELLIERHEVLRTAIVVDGGEPRQVVHAVKRFELTVVDARGESGEAEIADVFAAPFDLAQPPLVRARLVRCAPDEHVLAVAIHHIASDAWSATLAIRELAAVYGALVGGSAPALPELPIQYADLAVWQRAQLTGGAWAQQLAYWKDALGRAGSDGEPPSHVLELPADRPRPAVQSYRAGSARLQLSAERSAQLQRFAVEQRVSPFAVVFAAFAVLLQRVTGRDDLFIGTPASNRLRAETESLLGALINNLVIRADLGDAPAFAALARRIGDALVEAQRHQDVPFEQLVDALAVTRSLAHAPLFQVMVAQQLAIESRVSLAGLALEPIETPLAHTESDLTLLAVCPPQGAVSLELLYSVDLFEHSTIERTIARLAHVIGALLDEPDAAVTAHTGVLAEERAQLAAWNATAKSYAGPHTLAAALEAQLARTPDASAVRFGDAAISYRVLHERANQVAHGLRAAGVGRESIVAVCMERSLELVVALVGIAKAGAAYLPIDPELPAARIAYMLSDAAAPVVLTQARLRARLPAGAIAHELDGAWPAAFARGALPLDARLPAGAIAHELDGAWPAAFARGALPLDARLPAGAIAHELDGAWPTAFARGALPLDAQPTDLAYVIYTSGSTGQPKGVLTEQGALLNRLWWMQDEFALDERDRVLQKTPYSFDVSVWEFFWPLITGAELVMAKPEGHRDSGYLVEEIQRAGITTLHFVPSMLQAFVMEPGLARCTSLRQVFASGEALSVGLMEQFQARHAAALVNLYGPTEAAIDVSMWRCDRGATRVPIGRPIANVELHVLDGAQRLLPIGAAGELYIGGIGPARGYLNRPELTAERFVADAATGQRLYRTGDRCRLLGDGTIEYLGRFDDQVKLRGQRIELGEIEAQLRAHPTVGDAAVVLRGDGASGQLVAYVVPADGALDEAALRAHLARALPAYMVPAAIVELAALPLSAHGKLDRKALPAPVFVAPDLSSPPEGEIECAIAALWAELLCVPAASIGRSSNFFALGGHSLLATVLLARMRDRFGAAPSLRDLFERPTPEGLAARLPAANAASAALVPQPRGERLPLSHAQERLWFLSKLSPESAEYNITAALELDGALDVAALGAAFSTVIARHEVLRSRIVERSGGPEAMIDPPRELALAVETAAADTDEDWRAIANARAAALAAQPFDLACDRPIRAHLLCRADRDRCVLVVVIHHAVADLWSMQVLFDELAIAYRADSALAPLPIQYVDYAIWQRAAAQREQHASQLAYWRATLESGDYALELPTDGVRDPADRAAGAATLALPPRLVRELRAYAAARGTTMYAALLAALDVLLARHAGQRDVRVGTAVANRALGATQRLIGCFVNTLVIRADVDPAQSFDALLAQVTERVVAAQEHQDVPFEQVVEALAPARDLAQTPLFQVLFVMQRARVEAAAWPGVEVRELAVPPAAAKFDLDWEVHDDGERVAVRLEYRRGLFEPATMARWLAQWEAILEQAVAASSTAVGEIAVALPEERAQLAAWNATAKSYAGPHTLAAALAAQLARTPDASAVRFGDAAISYRVLHERANQVAHGLRAAGVGRETIVAVCMERSLELVVALVGIAKAGAAYLPIDPELPAARIDYMLRDAAVPVVLTQARLRERLPAGAIAHELDGAWPTAFARAALPLEAQPTDLAYVIYTSGSTGQPKGVLTEQGALLNRLWWMQDEFALDERDRVLQKTPYSFDVSVWEFFWPLITGAELVMAKPEGHRDSGYLVEEIQRAGITTLHFVPSMLQAFATEPGLARCTSLRQVFASGEALSVGLMEQFQARHAAALVNLYGPTEAAIDVSMWRCERGATRVPIGRPIANVTLHVLDEARRAVPIGAAGELYIGGIGPARGYLNRPELTAERFVADAATGQRLYRTGDRSRLLVDGTIEYLGRLDDQVKLRGQRIELGEIEAQLRGHAAVREAAVILRDDGAGAQLVAYVVPAAGALDEAALRAHLARELPAYMVPAAIVELAALPLSAHGKLDRKALPAPTAAAQDEFEPPSGALETALAAIWAEVLQVSSTSIGRRSHFFRLGGHSLLATVALARMREQLGAAPPLRHIFDHPTLAAIAAIFPAVAAPAAATIVPGPRPARTPLSHAQERLWFLSKLSPESAEYNIVSALELRGPLDEAALQRALSAVIARHEVLRTRIVESADAGAELAIDPPGEVPFGIESLAADDDAAWSAVIAARATAEAQRPFDLARDRLIRARLVRRSNAEQRLLLLAVHHIAADDWSMSLLADELARAYRTEIGEAGAALAALPIQYADYAIWQRAQSEQHAAQLAYWRAALDGGEPALELPTDHPRGAAIATAAAAEHRALSPDLTGRVRQLAHDRGTTPYTVLLAAAKLLLARYSGQRDVRIGTAVANRALGETQRLIGCFVNTLVIRADVDPAQSFDALLAQVTERVMAAQEHQDVPFEQVVEALAPVRDLAQTPLFQVLFVMQHARVEAAAWPGVEVREVAVPPAAAKFDLNWEVHDDGERVAVRLEYRRGLFEPATMARWLAQWEAILEQVVAASSTAVGEIAVMDAAERAQLAAWNATAKLYAGPHTLAAALVAQLARTPDASAVRFGDAAISYRVLHERANQVAHGLRAAGVGRETIVAVCMERSLELVVALVGIAKAGAAYLPIDPELPAARIAYMLRDAAVPVVLTQARLRARLPSGAIAHALDGAWPDAFARAELPLEAQPTDLAYVIYTSGSTGQPKGVLTEQRALLNRLWWIQDEFALDGRDRVLQKTPYSFDVSVWEFFWPLIAGAELVMAKPGGHRDSGYLVEEIQRAGITTLHFVPSMLQAFVTEPGLERCTSVRQVFASGEALSAGLMEQFQARHAAPLVNLYGPTEAAIEVSVWRCERGAARVPIGRPIANVTLHVLDGARRALPIGAVGELYIGGIAPARGYLNRPELTAERFVEHAETGERLYRTGDRSRLLVDGTIEYLGRLDDQVKLRGQRIELGEIEAQLRGHAGVREAAVILRDDGAGAQLVAYVVAAEGALDEAALRAHLARELPAYMVPAAIVELGTLPLSAHGKLDRKALPAPAAATAAAYVAPSTEAETILCEVIAGLVRRERVGVDDNFFALGGDSILALQVVARARARGIALTPKQLFQERTIGALAAVVGRSTAALAEQGVLVGPAPLLPIQRWFFEEQAAAPQHWNQSVLLQPSAPLVAAHVRAALAQVAAQHDALRLRWTRGAAGWEQRYVAELDAFAFDELTLLAGSDLAARLAPAAAGLDLATGPIARAVLVRIPDGQRLFLAVHHLAIDAVSWRILLDDFARAYRQLAAGESLAPGAKSTSYRQWAERIVRYADSPGTQSQLAYWRSRSGPRLPVDDGAAPNVTSDEISLVEALTADDTRALLEEAPRAYRTQPDELLLAALALTAAEWTASGAIAIDVEGHGRDPLFPELDASRTVGWFTSLYPVRFELADGAPDVGAAIRTVKETLRAVPEHGLGYGALRYAAGAALPSSDVLFNYLGNSGGAGGLALALAPEPGPRDRAADSARSHELEVVAFVQDGALHIEWRTSARRIECATSARWLARFVARLREVVQHCLDPRAGSVTPSDFPLAKKLDQRALDAVRRKLGGLK